MAEPRAGTSLAVHSPQPHERLRAMSEEMIQLAYDSSRMVHMDGQRFICITRAGLEHWAARLLVVADTIAPDPRA